MTISQRYVAGDFHNAVNGYWSPWSCWLTALVAKTGIALGKSSVLANSAAGILWLVLADNYFKYFKTNKIAANVLTASLVIFLWFAVFWQSFDDLWECVFLLCSLRILLSPDYTSNVKLWLLNGICGALAYFAKAYAFPFFILNTVCCTYLIFRQNRSQWLVSLVLTFSVFVAIASPWIMLLHEKYGIWTTSTAGSLNMSWYLVGHPEWKVGIRHLVAPVSSYGLTYWEDPYLANGTTPHFWNSWHLFGLQTVRLGVNAYKFLISLSQLSVCIVIVCTFFIEKLIKNIKNSDRIQPQFILLISILLFPLGYALINFESRYLWYMIIPGMVLLGTKMEDGFWVKKISPRIILTVIIISIVAYPVYGLVKMYDAGKSEYELAEELPRLSVHDSFTSNRHPRIMSRLAYFIGDQYYYNIDLTMKKSAGNEQSRFDSVIADAARLGVRYYFQFKGKDDCYQSVVMPTSGIYIINGTVLQRVFTFPEMDVWKIVRESELGQVEGSSF